MVLWEIRLREDARGPVPGAECKGGLDYGRVRVTDRLRLAVRSSSRLLPANWTMSRRGPACILHQPRRAGAMFGLVIFSVVFMFVRRVRKEIVFHGGTLTIGAR